MHRWLAFLLAAGLLVGCARHGLPAAAAPPAQPISASTGATPPAAASADAQPHIPGPIPVLGGQRSGSTVNVTLTAEQKDIEIAPGVTYHAWTFGGSVPGPVIRVRQGDTVHFTLVNNDQQMSHSIDFHAAQTPWSKNYQAVGPGQSFSFDWTANHVGVFMYHCGTDPVIEHIANGMYGAIIVDPQTPRPAAREYVIVQGEWYKNPTDLQDMFANLPSHVVFNGYVNRYKLQPLPAKPGELIRLYVVDAGPNRWSAFHVIGAMFSTVQPSGNPENQLHWVQTYTVAPGDAAVFELTIPEAGKYPFVTHSFADASMGAVGLFDVTPDAPAATLVP